MKYCLDCSECMWINPVEGNTDYCASHNKLRRDAEKQARKDAERLVFKFSKKSAPRPKPNKVSEKRKVLNEEYFKLVEQFKIDNPKCHAKIEGCTEATDDPHHTRGRGKYLLDVATWIPVCRSCHIYITDHPADAIKRNLSFSRLEKRETI